MSLLNYNRLENLYNEYNGTPNRILLGDKIENYEKRGKEGMWVLEKDDVQITDKIQYNLYGNSKNNVFCFSDNFINSDILLPKKQYVPNFLITSTDKKFLITLLGLESDPTVKLLSNTVSFLSVGGFFGKLYKEINYEEWGYIAAYSKFIVVTNETLHMLDMIYNLGAIPVYIWTDTKKIPYIDMIDYYKMMVMIHFKDLSKTGEILKTFSDKHLDSMRSYYEKCKYCFKPEGIEKYIVKKMIRFEQSVIYMDNMDKKQIIGKMIELDKPIRHLEVYNDKHLGDCVITIMMFNNIKQYLETNNIFITYYTLPQHVKQLSEFICTPNIDVLDIHGGVKGLNMWLGSEIYENNYFLMEDEIKEKKITSDGYFINLANEIFKKLEIETTIDILEYTDDDLIKRYNDLKDKYKNLDYLILNNVPMSGQYKYNENKDMWDTNIKKLVKEGKKIVTILKVDDVPCTLDDSLTVKDIAAISTHCKNLIAIDSGPFIGCLNTYTITNVERIVLYGDAVLQNLSYKNFEKGSKETKW